MKIINVNADVEQLGEIKVIGFTPSVIPLSGYWKECDGSVVNDSDSLYNGKRVFNLNGDNVILTVTWTADGGGAYCTVGDDDINALNVGDRATGTGITNVNGLPPIIIDITGNIVTINNTATTGEIESTFTNDGIYLGGGSDGSIGDQTQGHYHYIDYYRWSNMGDAGNIGPGYRNTNNGNRGKALTIFTDGANGTPRTGNRTRPHTRFVKMIMRIK